MTRPGLDTDIIDPTVVAASVRRCAEQGIRLPTFAELADPVPASGLTDGPRGVALSDVDPDAADSRNLYRVHWYNAADRTRRTDIPEHLVLTSELTGVRAPIILLLGDRFPLIGAHKVLAAYACLAPRIVTGAFDPSRQRAIWPSTGNYCRGGVAISRIMGCRGVAVLPEGMSRERFEWLERWVSSRDDIIRTPGTESNVKEIYDVCNALALEPDTVIFNQFSEYANHLVHYAATGPALERVVRHVSAQRQEALEVAAFVSASGSAGTLGAGDYLKESCGSRTVAVEARECPTMLLNGFGEHNIQGIGDKHIPLIHNVMATDFVIAISERSTDGLNVLCNSEAGRRYLSERRGLPPEIAGSLGSLGLSSLCNIIAAIKMAKYLELGERQAVVTVATDGAELYTSEIDKALARDFPRGFDDVAAGEVFGEHVLGASTADLLELDARQRARIFNLGYFTWVEQQGVSIDAFEARRRPEFWRDLRKLLPAWDALITDFNQRVDSAR